MPALLDMQRAMQAVIGRGPALLQADMFAGPPERVLLGLKAHANTISHARLISLEESFPETRERLGTEGFNRLSRAYVEAGRGCGEPLALIGRDFLAWLADATAGPEVLIFAEFEWAWLEAYGAADAEPLSMSDIAGLDESDLLALQLAPHPSARIVGAEAELCAHCEIDRYESLLLVRPEHEVRVHGLSPYAAALFAMLIKSFSLNDALESIGDDPAEAGREFVRLVEAGALICPVLHTSKS